MGYYDKPAQRQLNNAMRKDRRWIRLSRQIRDRDGQTCCICNMTEGPFETHHLFYQFYLWDSPHWSLICLCEACHKDNNGYVWTPQLYGDYGGPNTGNIGIYYEALLLLAHYMRMRGISIRQLHALATAIPNMTDEQWADFAKHIPADLRLSRIIRLSSTIVPVDLEELA